MSAEEVLEFWFQQCRPWQWFRRRDSFDALVRERFGEAVECALAGDLNHWSCAPSSGLALVLLLDQFPRQIWRGEAKAFAGDPQALQLSLEALERGWIAAESQRPRRQFWLMPQLHSEDISVLRAVIPCWSGTWMKPPQMWLAAILRNWSGSGVTRGATLPSLG